MVSRRVVSGFLGLILFAVALGLEAALPDRPTVRQVTFLTIAVFSMVGLANFRQHRENWFWKAMVSVVLVHLIVLFNLKDRLPFPSLGVVILLSALEAILLQAVVVLVSRAWA